MIKDKKISALIFAAGILPALVTFSILWFTPHQNLTVDWNKIASRDFVNLWMAGNILAQGPIQALWQPDLFTHLLEEVIHQPIIKHMWSYPPAILLLAYPLAKLDFMLSYAIWNILGLAALFLTLKFARLPFWVCIVAALSPGAMESILAGQVGVLVAVFLAGGLLLMRDKPVISGILFGCLLIKPHFGVLLPVCVIATQNWRVIYSTAITAVILIAASSLFFGADLWHIWLTVTRTEQTAVLEAAVGTGNYQTIMLSVFMASRWMGASVGLSYAIQAFVTLLSIIMCWKVWRDQQSSCLYKIAITLALTYLAVPYGYSYDTCALSIAVLLLVVENKGRISFSMALAWLWPAYSLFLGPILATSLHKDNMLCIGSFVIILLVLQTYGIGRIFKSTLIIR